MVLGLCAGLFPFRMITILQSSFCVTAQGLYVSPIIFCDAYLAPCRGDRELLYPRFYRFVAQRPAFAVEVNKALAAATASQRKSRRSDVSETVTAAEFFGVIWHDAQSEAKAKKVGQPGGG